MNTFNPKKLIHSKWTAVNPVSKEKHFLVTELAFDEQGEVTQCLIEAVISKRSEWLEWDVLKSTDDWLQGWK